MGRVWRRRSSACASRADARGSAAWTGKGRTVRLCGPFHIHSSEYGGARAGYAVNHDAAGWHVADQRGQEGADTLLEVERIRFADGALALDTDGDAGQAYRLYRAAFDRAPGLQGLGYWIGVLDKGATLQDIAGGFAGSQEFADLYGSAPDNAETVQRLYRNVLHRAPEQGGFDYWLNVLDKKLDTLAGVLASFSESAKNQDAVAELIGNGIVFTPYAG